MSSGGVDLNPFNADPADDLLHEPDAVALWSESYCFFGFDATAETGVFLHLTTVADDPRLWRGVAAVYRPGGRLLVNKAFGRAGSADGPGNGPLKFSCVQPLRTWRLTLDSAACELHRSELANGPLTDRTVAPLSFDLTFDGDAPLYDLGQNMTDDQSWGQGHHQQAGTIRGTVALGGTALALDGHGYRDHSWGPRDLTFLSEITWAHAHFPSGRVFCSIDVRGDGYSVDRAYIVVDGHLHPVTTVQSAPLDSRDATPATFDVRLSSGDRDITIAAEVVNAFTYTFAVPNDIVVGAVPDQSEWLISTESATRYTWDGETTVGLCERIRRGGTLWPSRPSALQAESPERSDRSTVRTS